MSIQIFVTGGTFDKEYNLITGQLYFNQTHLQELLDLGRSQLDCAITTLLMMDSLDMTHENREFIAMHCHHSARNKILITHGTDTMTETAKVLAEQVKDKTIVITGAMIPIKFGSSDGLFNIGSALAFVQTLPHGVYIAMNGQCFPWDKVRKNKETGFFEAIE